MKKWTRLQAIIFCKHKGLDAVVWKDSNRKGKTVFKYSISKYNTTNGSVQKGTANTEEEAVKVCEKLLEG